jgi:hypothetical protein
MPLWPAGGVKNGSLAPVDIYQRQAPSDGAV